MAVSLKQMAESIEQIRLAMKRVEVGQHRHWVSPYWEEKEPGITSQSGLKSILSNNTHTTIQILNPSSKPVSATINVFDRSGSPIMDAAGASLNPRSMQFFTLFNLLIMGGVVGGGVGWLDILADGPIFPSGHVSEDATPSTGMGNTQPLQTVGFPLHFYPVEEAQ
jgi:hypothetical protein